MKTTIYFKNGENFDGLLDAINCHIDAALIEKAACASHGKVFSLPVQNIAPIGSQEVERKWLVSKKPYFLALILFLTLNVVKSFADDGPSDGGGTNVTIKEEELVDFVNFKNDFQKKYGGKIYNIDSTKFHQSNQPVIYNDVKPILDRMDYFYPGASQAIDATFEKDWVAVDARFQARNGQEKKVISQTEDVVYLDLQWLKKASPDKVKRAFVHEGVRNYVETVLVDRAIKKAVDAAGPTYAFSPSGDLRKQGIREIRAKYNDLLTETITPLLYEGMPFRDLDRATREVVENMHNELDEKVVGKSTVSSDVGPFPKFSMTARNDLYSALAGVETQKIFDKVCSYSKTNKQNPDSLILAEIKSIGEHLGEYYGKNYAGRINNSLSLQPRTKALLNLNVLTLDMVRDPDLAKKYWVRSIPEICKAIGEITAEDKKFLGEILAEKGKIKGPFENNLLDHLPDEELSGANEKAL